VVDPDEALTLRAEAGQLGRQLASKKVLAAVGG